MPSPATITPQKGADEEAAGPPWTPPHTLCYAHGISRPPQSGGRRGVLFAGTRSQSDPAYGGGTWGESLAALPNP